MDGYGGEACSAKAAPPAQGRTSNSAGSEGTQALPVVIGAYSASLPQICAATWGRLSWRGHRETAWRTGGAGPVRGNGPKGGRRPEAALSDDRAGHSSEPHGLPPGGRSRPHGTPPGG